MDLTTEDGVKSYLQSGLYPSCTSVDRLTDGSCGFVYRAHQTDPAHPASFIIKHVEGYAARAPTYKLGQDRLDFENRALDYLSSITIKQHAGAVDVRTPRVLTYDAPNHTLILEDVGVLPSLKTWLQAGAALDSVAAIGTALGRYLAQIHDLTAGREDVLTRFDGNETSKSFSSRLYYSNLAATAAKYGYADAYFQEAAEVGQREVLESHEVLTIGDFWTGNVLVADNKNEKSSTSATPVPDLFLVDLEFAKPGTAAFDIGQMAAEMYCLAAFRDRERGLRLLNSFLTAYRERRQNATVDAAKVAVRIGAHFFAIMPFSWTDVASEEQVREELKLGAELIRMGMEGDRKALEESIVRPLIVSSQRS